MITTKTKKTIEEKHLDNLIERAHRLIDNTDIASKKSRMEEAQFHNVLSVACATESFKVVENFICYQIGRDRKRENWRFNDFGEKLLDELIGLEEKAKEIAKESGDDYKTIWIELVRNFLGYLSRYFVYERSKKEER